MRPMRTLALGLLASTALILAIIHYMPPIDDFNPANPFWNGMSGFYEQQRITLIQDLRLVPNRGAGQALLIIGPSRPFLPSEMQAVQAFASNGGMLIVCDDFGTANELLEGLRLSTRFSGELLEDPLFNIKNPRFPRATEIWAGNISTIALNYATILKVGDTNARALAWSSHFSYIDENRNERHDATESVGSFPIMAVIPYGQGSVYLISDSSTFINGMIIYDDNAQLTSTIAGGRNLLLDASHWSEGPLTMAKDLELKGYLFFSRPDVRYTIFFISLILILRVRKGRAAEIEGLDEVEKVMMEHPDWDAETLRKIKEDREEYGAN